MKLDYTWLNSWLSLVADFSAMNSDAMDADTKPWLIWTFASQNRQLIIALICSNEDKNKKGKK